MIVAREAPKIPKSKTNIKIGSKIKFKIFVNISKRVGILEFPSACNVFTKRLEKRNTKEQINIGKIYVMAKSTDFVTFNKLKISSRKKVDNMIPMDNTQQATMPCRIELYDSSKSFFPSSLDIIELVPMPTESPNVVINVNKGAITPIAKNAS